MLTAKSVLKEAEAQPNYWHGVFKRTFSTSDGKKCLIKILESSGIFTTSSGNIEHCNWVDGRRSLALEIFETVKVNPLDVVLDGEAAQDSLAERMSKGGDDE